MDYFKEACNTLKATRWQLFCARWLGKKRVATEGNTTVIFYEYQGVLYMVDVKDQP